MLRRSRERNEPNTSSRLICHSVIRLRFGVESLIHRNAVGATLAIGGDFLCDWMPAIEGEVLHRRHKFAFPGRCSLNGELTHEAFRLASIKNIRHCQSRSMSDLDGTIA